MASVAAPSTNVRVDCFFEIFFNEVLNRIFVESQARSTHAATAIAISRDGFFAKLFQPGQAEMGNSI